MTTTTNYQLVAEDELYNSIATKYWRTPTINVEWRKEDNPITDVQFVQQLIQNRVLTTWLANEIFEANQEQLVQARNDLYNDSVVQAENMISIQ